MENIYDYIDKQIPLIPIYKPLDLEDYKLDYIGNIALIEELINNKLGKVLIFSDFDSDGTNSGIILSEVMNAHCIDFYWHISSRKDGYGLKTHVLDKLQQEHNFQTIITADLGITNKSEVEYARSIGFKNIIVTDHHNISEDKLPNADLIINNKIVNNQDMQVCGAGLCYLIFKPYYESQSIKIIAGIATIGDMVPVHYSSINRKIVQESLWILNNEKIQDETLRYFISSLIYNFNSKTITEMDYGFSICPAINSLSRYNQEHLIKDYFQIDNKAQKRLLEEIKDINDKRKIEQYKLQKSIINIITLKNKFVNIIILPNANKGLLGLVSSFILNTYHSDNCVLTKVEGGYAGSGRSKLNSLYDFLKSAPQEYMGSWGGHQKACGLFIKEEFIEQFQEYARNYSPDIIQPPYKKYVYEIEYNDINNKYLKSILLNISPFGQENLSPEFLLTGRWKILKVKVSRQHYFLYCSNEDFEGFDSQTMEIIVFNYFEDELKINKVITNITGSITQEGNFLCNSFSVSE